MQYGFSRQWGKIIVALALLLLLVSLSTSDGFSPVQKCSLVTRNFKTTLNLIPLSQFRHELSFFDQSESHRCCIDDQGRLLNNALADEDRDKKPFELCIVEEDDLPEVTLFIIKAFGADAINLSSNEFSKFEKALIEPALDFFNGYASVSAFAEVLWGLRLRLKDRILEEGNKNDISPPDFQNLSTNKEKNEAASRNSLLLVLARQNNEKGTNSSKWVSIDSDIDVIASVELQLQPADGKIPFSLPWWDRIERKIGSFFGFPKDPSARNLQPYLSSLCVDEIYRNKQIGKAMVRCLEDIVVSKWGYSKLYLHVDADNPPALKLYQREGYKDARRRWTPFWAGKAGGIGYFVKDLRERK